MPYRNMTLAELAKHTGIDQRIIKKWADKGILPGQLIQNQWRFNRATMLDWLQREMHALDEEHLHNLEHATADDPSLTSVSNLLAIESINLMLPAKSKPSVLRELVSLAEQTDLVYDRDEIIANLEEREDLCPTALAGGYAFPHPRRPLPYATAESLVAIGIVPAGIPFGSPDRQLTDIFVLVCSHDERAHLHVLARLAALFNLGLADELREAETSQDALEAIFTAEQKLLHSRR